MPGKFLSSLTLFILFHSALSQTVTKDRVDSILSHGQELLNISSEKAIDRMQYALKAAEKNEWTQEAAQAYKYLGIGHFYLGSFDKAQECYLTSLALFEEVNDLQGMAQVCNELGVFYSKQEDYDASSDYYARAQKIATENSFLKELAISLSNQGMTLFKLGEHDEAFPLMSEALEVKQQLNDSIGMGYELKRLATYYFVKKKFELGMDYLNQSSSIREKLGDQSGLAINTVTLAEMYQQRELYSLAIPQFKKTLQLASEIGYADLARYALDMLHQCYSSIGDFTNAYQYQTQARELADSLFNDRKSKAISELQTKYETAEKEQQIANQQLELEIQRANVAEKQNFIVLLVAGFGIAILIGIVYYNRNKAAQKAQLQAAILKEKERGFESVIIATEEERKRISKDLHDGIGQQLSALKMALNNLVGKVSDDQQREDLELISEQFSKSAEEVRQVSHQMMPCTLMDYGLIGAIEDLLQNSFKFSDIQFEFEHHHVDQRFDERIEISLYRVLQELINNVIKHSEATEVSVQLLKNKDRLVLFVEDNGKGMDGAKTNGHGFLNIKSRLDMVKGSVNYTPSPDSGTSATVSIPII